MSSSAALRALFHPHEPEQFVEAARANKRLFLSTDRASVFADLLPWPSIAPLISIEGLIAGKIRAMRQGRDLPLEMLTAVSDSKGRRVLAPDVLQQLCHQGLSLILNSIDSRVPAIEAMNAMIERYLRCRTFTNAYISFRRDSAFKAHYDNHNVLILQIHGSKRWWCHGQVDRLPVRNRSFTRLDQLPSAEWEHVLEPGDMLFIPRGDVHHAQVEDENSVHLTVTMIPPNGEDVLKWLGRQSLKMELAREDIPPMATVEELSVRTHLYKEMLRDLIDGLDLAEFLKDADRERPPARPINFGIAPIAEPGVLVQPSLRRHVPLELAFPGELEIKMGDATVRLSQDERRVLFLLLERDSLTVAELAATFPGIDVPVQVAALARKSVVFLFDTDISRGARQLFS